MSDVAPRRPASLADVREPRNLTPKRAAALLELASWPETRQYRRKEGSMAALNHLGLTLRPDAGWLLTDRGRRVALAMLNAGQEEMALAVRGIG